MKIEHKDVKFLKGEPTNTFTTGIPKLNTEGAMTVTGSGIVVAKIFESAADGAFTEVAEKVMSAALGKVTEKAGKLVGEYTTKFITLPTTIPTKIATETKKRFELTAEEAKKLGDEFAVVKKSIPDLLLNFTSAQEEIMDSLSDSIDEAVKNKKIDEQKAKLKKIIDSANDIIERTNENIKKILMHIEEGPEWVQQNIDAEINRVEQNVRDQLESGYKTAEKEIDTFCKNEGNKIGEKLVGAYNKTIAEAAKNINDQKQKGISKAKILAKSTAHKAKLQLYAMMGL